MNKKGKTIPRDALIEAREITKLMKNKIQGWRNYLGTLPTSERGDWEKFFSTAAGLVQEREEIIDSLLRPKRTI